MAETETSLKMSLLDLGKQLLECAKHGDVEEVRLLMRNGAPFTTDWLGNSPLHMAALYGHLTTTEILLKAGISHDAKTKVDRTPLHIASQEGHTDIVEMLIKFGSDVNATDLLHMTPLHWAVERGHIPVIYCLLTYSAETHISSKFNKTPFDIAEDNGRPDIVQILQENVTVRKKIPNFISSKTTAPRPINKGPIPIAPKPLPLLPIHIVNQNSIANIRKLTAKSVNTTTTVVSKAVGTNIRTLNSSLPVVLHSNSPEVKHGTTNQCDGEKLLSSGDEGDNFQQSCTNVLATLAALAEATAPNTTLTTQEAVQWLELQGITMLPSDNSTIVATAIEGGQTVSLTEAGKLALTWVKEHKDRRPLKQTPLVTKSTALPSNYKVITVVNDKSPLVLLSGQNGSTVCEPPKSKKVKLVEKKESKIEKKNNSDDERLMLQKELEKMKKEAAEYKAQLCKKEQEAEEYKKELEKLKSSSNENLWQNA